MNLHDYTEMPSEGLYDKIEKRVRRRRMMRRGGAVLATVAVLAGFGAVLYISANQEPLKAEPQAVAMPVDIERSPVSVDSHPVAANPTDRPHVQSIRKASPEAAAPALASSVQEYPATLTPNSYQEPALVDASDVEPARSENHTQAVLPVRQSDNTEGQLADIPVLGQQDTPPSAPALFEQSAAKSDAGNLEPTPVAEPDLLWVPNAILPNADDDAVRQFSVKWSSPVAGFNIRIFNRRGLMVFQSSDPDFRWDATHNGSAVPQGTYVWIVSYRDSQGVSRQKNGTLTVVR